MERFCATCSLKWKPIVDFCPQCGTDLRVKAEAETKEVAILSGYENQSSKIFKSPILWIFIALLALAAIFTVTKSGDGNSSTSQAQGNQESPQEQANSSVETQVDQNNPDPGSSEEEVKNSPNLNGLATQIPQPTTTSKTFTNPKSKAPLTLEAWLQRYDVNEALKSIQNWSATFRTMNPTQIDETEIELEDARGSLFDALNFLDSKGLPRISAYDQQQKDLTSVIEEFLDSTSELSVQINNEYGNSREDVVNLLEEKIKILSKVNNNINALQEWIKVNGSKYESR